MPALGRNAAAAIVDRAAARYFAARRAAVPGFARRHFGLGGSLRIHRRAFGWDLLRAPANLALAIPHVLSRGGGWAARRLGFPAAGDWLAGRQVLRDTDVAREVRWLVMTELLELPYRAADGRTATRDALAEAVLADPQVSALLAEAAEAAAGRGADPAFRARLEESLAEYAGSRAAAAEITTALVTLGAGAALFHQATPGVVALGPAVAAALAQSAAIAAFPLGATLGGLWYGVFPAAAGAGLVAGTTAALAGVAAIVTAFAGIVADPVQTALGLHQRRLFRLIDALEVEFGGAAGAGFTAHEHYVARLVDLADILAGVIRAVRG